MLTSSTTHLGKHANASRWRAQRGARVTAQFLSYLPGPAAKGKNLQGRVSAFFPADIPACSHIAQSTQFADVPSGWCNFRNPFGGAPAITFSVMNGVDQAVNARTPRLAQLGDYFCPQQVAFPSTTSRSDCRSAKVNASSSIATCPSDRPARELANK